METENEWLKIYHECCHMFNKEGDMDNRVRLKLGQFSDDDVWGCVEILCANKEVLRKIIEVSDKYNLWCDFTDCYTIKLRKETASNADNKSLGEQDG